MKLEVGSVMALCTCAACRTGRLPGSKADYNLGYPRTHIEDLDSLVSAIALAYDLAHTKHVQQKAIALLQVENSAIDLRPENKLALEKARMETGHKDLLGELVHFGNSDSSADDDD